MARYGGPGKHSENFLNYNFQHRTDISDRYIKTLKQNASNAQSMIIEIIKTFHSFSPKDDPANDCLDTAIITQPRYQSKKTIQKLKHIAGRVLNKK